MRFEKFIEQLKLELENPLPGNAAHLKMAPGSNEEIKKKYSEFPVDAKRASTVCLLFPINDEPHFTLIKRTEDGRAHSGQIAFPGGRIENEESKIEAAIRETEEELGFKIYENNILKELTNIYVFVSQFIVFPFLAFTNKNPNFIAQESEVAQILKVKVADLLDDKNCMRKDINVRGMKMNVPCFLLNNQIVWGATAVMLSEIKEIIKGLDL